MSMRPISADYRKVASPATVLVLILYHIGGKLATTNCGEKTMIPVKSMTEEKIGGVAEAFADYSYTDGEHGLIYLFSKREALIAYLRVMVQAGLKAGMFYTNGPNREGFIIITESRLKCW